MYTLGVFDRALTLKHTDKLFSAKSNQAIKIRKPVTLSMFSYYEVSRDLDSEVKPIAICQK